MNFYEDINIEHERIQNCIRKFGWTSDHNLDWFVDCIISKDGRPVFVEFSDGTGLLTHKYKDKWRIWSDPLCKKDSAAGKVFEFADYVLNDEIKEVWCDDVSDNVRPILIKNGRLTIGEIYYSLLWPILDMEKYNPTLPGRYFKEMRNAKNKFYREHKLEVANAKDVSKEKLNMIIERWKQSLLHNKEDVYDLRYHNAINDSFKGFVTARVFIVDGAPVGINAGYEVPNKPGRFTGVIGIHDYSVKEIGLIMYLEDLEWMKNAGYAEVDLQGSEEGKGLDFKIRFGTKIERKTDTFCIKK